MVFPSSGCSGKVAGGVVCLPGPQSAYGDMMLVISLQGSGVPAGEGGLALADHHPGPSGRPVPRPFAGPPSILWPVRK